MVFLFLFLFLFRVISHIACLLLRPCKVRFFLFLIFFILLLLLLFSLQLLKFRGFEGEGDLFSVLVHVR